MASSYGSASRRLHGPRWHRRAGGLALALVLNLLLILALLGIGAARYEPRRMADVRTVDLLPNPAAEAPSAAPAPSVQPPAPEPASEEQRRPQPPRPAPLPPPPIPIERPLQMIELSRADYAAADIDKMAKSAAAAGTAAARVDDSEVIGRGPNGQALYAAEWVRRPTNAELRGYLPSGAPAGWGLIACRTVAGHRVEDCEEIANHPRGSRLASAVRQAAWQFRVRPPRKGGRELVGEWVQIRIEYVTR